MWGISAAARTSWRARRCSRTWWWGASRPCLGQRRLLGQADRRESVDGGVRFQLPATLAGPAAELAAAEQRCCPFFTFTLHLADGGLQLEVRAPAEVMPMVAEIFIRDR